MNTTLINSTFYYRTGMEFYFPPCIIIPIYAISFFLGLPLNIYIIILLFPSRGVMDPSDVQNLNQAIAEMFFLLLGPFHSLCSIDITYCFFPIVGFLLGTSVAARSVFPCCVCLERYLAVVHPVIFLKYKSTRYRLVVSIMVWLSILAVAVACAVVFPYMPYNVFSVMFLMVLSLDVFCCVSILNKLRHPGPQYRDSDVIKMNVAKRKAFQIISINLLVFLIQNIPISVTFGVENKVSEYVFGNAVVSSLAINTITGLWQPISVLYKTGQLSLIRSICFPTPLST